jgi:tRNA(adenine34) deaminase
MVEPDLDFDQHWMMRALEQAYQAADADEVPVGAVIVHNHSIIAASGNQCETLHDATAHAEMLSITQAAAALGDWRLADATLYVTLEPCVMCAGAILQSRLPRVVFGALDPKGGAVHSLYQLLADERMNHQCQVTGGVLAEQCGRVLTEFFAGKRAMGKK